jgi:transposase
LLSLGPNLKIYFCVVPVDMRRSFDSLAEVVRLSLDAEPMSGHLFVFRNKAQDCVKVLYWDKDGYAIWYKRLEKGKFELPSSAAASFEMTSADFSMLLHGFDASKLKRQNRYTPKSGFADASVSK